MSVPKDERLIAAFGVLTDVQYADCEDRPAGHDPTKTRFYRHSLFHVERAFEFWKTFPSPIRFVLQLGDIIDGLNSSLGGSRSALEKTFSKFECNHSIPTFHTVGNHELYNFCREELALLFRETVEKMNVAPKVFTVRSQPLNETTADVLYYSFCPSEHLKVISLDCFDVSVLGYDSSHPCYCEAAAVLEFHHKHSDFDLWDCNGPLEGLDVRFQQMNGAVGEKQLLWLEKELAESDKNGQTVVIFGHVGLSPDSTDWSCLLWNYDKVMACFHRHHCVVAYLCGHSHEEGYAIDRQGIHYIVFTGIVETPPDSSAFATVLLYPDRMEVLGCGREKSYSLKLQRARETCNSNSVSESDHVPAPSIAIKVEV